jgi:hypothetical protein
MIDYKLVLILALSIVLLYLYNRVDSLKEDLKSQNKIQIEQKELIGSMMKNQEVLANNVNQVVTTNSDLHKKNIVTPIKTNVECLDGICTMPNKIIDSINKVNITLLEEENTTEFSATEYDSDDESINLTTSDNVILYSNDKSDKESLNEKIISRIENLEEQNAEEGEDGEEGEDINEFINNIQLAHDLQSDNQILIPDNMLDEIINVESLIDKLKDEPIIFNKTFVNVQNETPSYVEVIETSNSHEENIEFTKIKQSYSELDYENSDEDDGSSNINLNTESCKLDILNKYKLPDLQVMAKTNNIELTTLKNGKIKNKTRKELYSELAEL